MAHNYTNNSAKRKAQVTPQTKPIPGREEDMAKNSAGGYSFALDKWKQLERFLILGSEGGTYYISEKKLTKRNMDQCLACIAEDPMRVLKTIVEVSDAGRAPKNDQAILLLATLFEKGNAEVKKAAAEVFPKVCRIGTHLFTFAQYLDDMRGWGRAVRAAVSNWYGMDPSRLEYQMVKYQGRTVEGTNNQWTHKDVLRLAHVKPLSEVHNALFKYAVKNEKDESLKLVAAYEELMALRNSDVKRSIDLILTNKIPHDAWPTELKNDAKVWRAALNDLPLTALIRNLGKLTAVGVIKQGNIEDVNIVTSKIANEDYIKKSRIHPMNILIARKIYGGASGLRGKLEWTPVQKVVDALEEAFYMSFKNIEPSGQTFLLGLDVSGSMGSQISSGIITCAEASALMAMVTARTEKNYEVMAFNNRFQHLDITPAMKFDQILKKVSDVNFGGTDCSLPMVWAKENKMHVDVFAVYTDNETWAGKIQPVQALKQYRDRHNNRAKLVVVGMTSNGFSIADPKDAGMLDIVGFDTTGPQIISEFAKGNV